LSAPPGQPVVAARRLTRRFGELTALDGLDLCVTEGEVVGILGHNGAGKTTFLRLVNGLLKPTEGEVRTFGQPAYALGAANRSRTGVVTESTALDDFLTIRESLVAYGTMLGVGGDSIHQRVGELLEAFEVAEVADLQVRELSAGMRQRAAFARALVHDPELLLLDEPTSNLDPLAARHVRGIVTEMARSTGRTVLLSTHNLAEAQDTCDRIAVLQHGRLRALGTMHELRAMVGRQAGTVHLTTGNGTGAEALAIAEGFGKASLDGTPDVIVVRDAEPAAIPRLVAALVRAEVPVVRVAEEETTLEDIYLALHQQRGGAP
jgi:ABC-2 type transport system ATP-binding protein